MGVADAEFVGGDAGTRTRAQGGGGVMIGMVGGVVMLMWMDGCIGSMHALVKKTTNRLPSRLWRMCGVWRRKCSQKDTHQKQEMRTRSI